MSIGQSYREATLRCGLVCRPKTHQAHVLLFSEGPSAQDPDRYALGLLSMILGDATGSKMYYDLIQTGLVESGGADTDERDAVGNFYAYAVTEPDRVEQVSQIMRKIVAATKDFTEADLNRAKTKSISRIVASGELPMGRLMALGSEWLYRQEIQNLAELMNDIKAVTISDIHKALERFPFTVLSEYHLMPA